MKQKIVMKVQMNCQKCRSKALKIAASAAGVNYVAIEGNDEDRVVVIGDGVDSISLINLMRKKVGHTDVVTVDEVKPDAEKKEEKGVVSEPTQWIYHYNQHPRFIRYEHVYETDPPGCSIM
ncbi:heavy metal-associated isoprenylated plant protein 47-like protein [Cinnamomum micranthum f. kanehirae]|uniref:Heavy metal-associated isoprenylated plant protein 47-like protein n=1 Tax=Cinnamomum micranthum f. kanehirae TaxID=337451 RepID=A0A3S3MRN1_9MAGN|nr:heavy metal-associated isoprenylated plant protein 47-like protein [Cinnamomum micranthum f. kanehirae]